jgi:DNA-binding response OmpR family regulator
MLEALIAHPVRAEAVRLAALLAGMFRCRTVDTAVALPKALWSGAPRLLVLHLSLSGLDLDDVLRLLREDDALSATSVLAILEEREEKQIVSALEAGVDDFVAEPLHPAEFRARARALVRPPREEPEPAGRVEAAGIVLDADRRVAVAGGRRVALSATECRLLAELAGRPGEVKSKENLIAHAWGMPFDVSAHTLDSHISNLRRKLGPPGRAIETVRGVGYVIGKRKR